MGSAFLKRLSRIAPKLTFPAAILIPFCLYLFLCQDFISGRITINIDTAALYTVTKYYINNLLQGIMPLWEPFIHSGRPFLGVINCGMLNPLINVVSLGVLGGLNYYDAYIVFILFYYFLGLIGFFILSRIILRSAFYAFFAYTALTLSGMGLMVFNQMIILLVFVPSVWFFVFLLRFLNGFQRRDFLGLVMAAMIMEISYYPFYLLTFFVVCVFVFLIYYPDRVKSICGNLLSFFYRHKVIVSIGLIGLVVSSLPLLLYKFRDQTNEIISPCRHVSCNTAALGPCLQGSAMKFEDVGLYGTFGERASFKALFSGFGKFSFLRDDCFYVSIFCLIIIFVSAFTYIDRLRKTILWIWFVTFLISLGVITPVYGFLFEHVFYFKYFRNLFFFMAYLIPILILFSMLQLKSLLSVTPARKLSKLIWVIVLHFIFLMIAHRQGGNLDATYLTIAASFAFFMANYFRNITVKNFHVAVIFMLIILQPLQVILSYTRNAASLGLNGPFFSSHVKPYFNFRRPINSRDGHPVFKFRDFDFESDLTMRDSDGRLVIMPYSVSRLYFLMINKMNESSVLGYIRNKFYLYNKYVFYNMNDEIIWKNVEQGITDQTDLVYAFDDRASEGSIKKNYQKDVTGRVQAVDEAFADFRVVAFNVNGISIFYRLHKPKFLVYTDNFTSEWRAYIDGHETQLYRSNIAFKGVLLPAGGHFVDIAYRPFGGTLVYWVCSVFLGVLMFLLCFIFLTRPGKVIADEDHDDFKLGVLKFSKDYRLLSMTGVQYLLIFVILLGITNQDIFRRIRNEQAGADARAVQQLKEMKLQK